MCRNQLKLSSTTKKRYKVEAFTVQFDHYEYMFLQLYLLLIKGKLLPVFWRGLIYSLNIELNNSQVDDLLSSVEKIDIEVRSLETCAYNSQTFRDVLGKVQRAVDELNLHSYSNLAQWVGTLDQQVRVNFHALPKQNFSLQYQYNIKQTSDENKEKYQCGDNKFIQY